MRKTCLLALLFAVPAWGAVETTRIQGKVIAPDGSAVTGGKIVCELSTQASAMDPALGQMVRIGSRYAATISATGDVDFTLVPNDITTPETTYSCRFSISGPAAAAWTETWSVATTPDPIAIGAVERVDQVPSLEHFVRRVSMAARLASTCSGTEVVVEAETGRVFSCCEGDWCLKTWIEWTYSGSPCYADGELAWDTDYGVLRVCAGGSWVVANSAVDRSEGSWSTGPLAFVHQASGLLSFDTHFSLDRNAFRLVITDDTNTACYSATGQDSDCDGTNDFTITKGDLDGDGTTAGADWNGDGTDDEAGGISSGAIHATRFLAQDSTNLGNTHVSGVAAMYTHAALYGDPDYYTRPSVVDSWVSAFHGHPLTADYDGDTTAGSADSEYPLGLISKCYNTSCVDTAISYICINSTDPDSDGTNEFNVHDLIYIGADTPKIRTHVIQAIADGDGTGCEVGTKKLTVYPRLQERTEGIDANADGTMDAGVKLSNAWANSLHPSLGMYYFLGYRILGYASRLKDGSHGPNLLLNGEMDHDGTGDMENWTPSTGALGDQGWASSPSESAYQCFYGYDNACVYFSNGSASGTITAGDAINVHSGERYVLSGLIKPDPDGVDTVSAYYDSDVDGTFDTEVSGTDFDFTSTFSSLEAYGIPNWFWDSWEIPDGVHQIKLVINHGDTSNLTPAGLDEWSLRRMTSNVFDNSLAASSYLINDPGERNIVITGDSWASGSSIETGLEDAMEIRLGRNIDSQIIHSGKVGATADDFTLGGAGANTCQAASHTGGSLNCWYDSVEQYEPLYVIWIIGTNDANASACTSDTTACTANFVTYLKEIVSRCRGIGAIPIFLSVNPASYGPFGVPSKLYNAHLLHNAQRRALLYTAP